MADALQLRPLHADRQGKDIDQHGSRRAAPDPRHPAAWLADRGHARARDRGVRDDRRHDGDDRRRCAAAHQLVFNVAGVCFMVPLGLAQAATVRVAYQLGRSEPSAARRAAYVVLAMGVLFMTAAALLLSTTPRILIGFYLDLGDATNQSTVAIALQLFVIAALFQLFDGVQVIAAGALRGYRDTAVPMLIAAIGYWAIGFAGGWLLAFPLGFGAVGLWLGLALGLAVVAIALGLRLRSRARLQIRAAETIVLAAGGVRV